MVMVCKSYESACTWERRGQFPTEERCIMNGLAIDPAVVRFKCVGLETQTKAERKAIPIPKPRPKEKQ